VGLLTGPLFNFPSAFALEWVVGSPHRSRRGLATATHRAGEAFLCNRPASQFNQLNECGVGGALEAAWWQPWRFTAVTLSRWRGRWEVPHARA